jgi:hypothetical protein
MSAVFKMFDGKILKKSKILEREKFVIKRILP